MSNYTITTDFGAKDDLPSGNASKVIKGSEFTTEFTNIKTAVNSKADSDAPTFTGATTFNGTVTLNDDVTFDTNTMFVDVSTNRVGIGNVEPATALDVTGVITTDGLTSSAGIDVTGTVTADGLTVDTNTLHVDATNDRVGIGTSSPSVPLDIIGQSIKLTGANPIFYFLDNTNTNTCSLQNTDGNFIYRADSGNQIGNSKHTFTIDGSNAMRIDTTGVGIGTTSPEVKLDVTEAYDTVSNILSNGSYAAKFSSSGTGDTGRTQGILLSGLDVNNRGVALLAEAQSTGNGHDFIIATSSTASTPTERMRIDALGNVGIGTSSPSQTLDVAGNIQATGTRSISAQFDSNHFMRLEGNSSGGILKGTDDGVLTTLVRSYGDSYFNGGNVGIGTDSPASNLHVSSSGDTIARITSADGSGAFLDLGDASDPDGGRIVYDSGSNLALYTASTERMRIDSSGNVGIGTSSPDSTLHVDGIITSTGNQVIKKAVPTIEFRSPDGTNGMNIKANLNDTENYGLQFEDKDGNNRIVIDPAGDVSFYNETDDTTAKFQWDASAERLGIGTDSPTEKLDIDGDSIRLRQSQTPASASATGTQGQIAWDANYIYICTATNTWKRVAIATW